MKKFLFIIVSLLSFSWALAQVNINTATAQELQTLNGIGPSKAAAIVEYRNANGPFKSPEDIKNVRGIGNGIYQKISSEITVGNGQATRTPAARPAAQQQQPQPAAAKPTTPAAKPAANKPAAARPAAAKPAAANP
ncbi:ComEA family DNA-binding protein [Eikenella halliae]|uniref:ComEA family DNA-binding protein n=1 Tax=Eikenella halliae TaxID=1795832 RepID=UPI00360B7352